MPPLEFHLANWPTALLAFLPLLLNVGILVYGYRKLTLDAQNVLYLLFVACAVSWQAFDLFVRISATAETAAFFRGYFRPGQVFAMNFGLHFVVLYIGREKVAWSAWFWSLLYLPPILQIGTLISGMQQEVLVYREGWGWVADMQQMHWTFHAYLLHGSVLGLLTTGLLLQHLRRVWHDPIRRMGTAVLASGMTLTVVIGIYFEALLPSIGVRQWPVTSTACVAFSIAVLWGQRRYRLFSVSTPAAAQVVVETVTDPLLIAAANGELLFANEGAVHRLGIDPNRIGTYDLTTLVQPGKSFDDAWRAVQQGRRCSAVEVDLMLPDGQECPFLLSLAPMALNRAGDAGVAVIAHDISDLKAYEQALEQARDEAEAANHSKSDFLASMSHELRTPLNVIIGYSELLEEELAGDDFVQDLLKIKTSGTYLLQLINDILDLSKVEAGHLEVMPESVDVRGMLEDLHSALLQLASNNHNTLVVEVATELPEAFADPMRLRQAILNLLSNAAKFTEHGTLTIAVYLDDPDHLFIDVTDTGIGMSEAQAGKLFGRFAQVHDNHHERYGGTGLGLALSRSLCQLMNGDLLVVRTAPGEGSTFRIVIPTADAGPRPICSTSGTPGSA